MTEITTLAPHDPVPSGRNVVVIRRFEGDAPDGATTQIIITGTPEESTHPRGPDGQPMHLDDAIRAARKVAESEGLDRVYVIDRLQGAREADVLRHDGDRSVHGERLQDSDLEDGERGADMRDIAHPGPAA